MRKTTINLILGILLGLVISEISNSVSIETQSTTFVPVATTITKQPEQPDPLELAEQIAPGLQIIQVPPPLDVNGLHPYQCYFNGEPVSIPKEVVEKILVGRTDPSKNTPDFNIHDFTGNLKMVRGRTRSVSGE